MQTFKMRGTINKMRGRIKAALLSAILAIACGPALAADNSLEHPTKLTFTSAVEAYRQGVAAYEGGDAKRAIAAFEYASDEGILGAQLRLARMYARGDLAPHNDAKAFEQYFHIVQGFANLDADHAGAKYVAEAYVAVGRYYENGVASAFIDANATTAARFYRHAASYFRSPVAQFKLARLYLKDRGVRRNIPTAAKWLHAAAKKNHAPSQALLAELLWAGGPVEKRAIQALALIDLALRNAAGRERPWITKLHQKMFDEAAEQDKKKAALILVEWRARQVGQNAQNTKSPKTIKKNVQQTAVKSSNANVQHQTASFHPDPVSVILGLPGGTGPLNAEAIFGAATQVDIPELDDAIRRGRGFMNAGATGSSR